MKHKKGNILLKKIVNIFCLFIFIIALLVFAKIYLPSFEKINYRDSVKLAKDEVGINMQLDYIPMKYIYL